MRVTINKINAEANKLGYEIVRGEGYFYFASIGEYPCLWASSVNVYHLSSYSVEGWIHELKELIKVSEFESPSFSDQLYRAKQGLKPEPCDPGPIKISYRKDVC